MKTGFTAICGNVTCYSISRKDLKNWACSAINNFNSRTPLIAGNPISIKTTTNTEAFKLELNHKIIVES